MTFVNPVLNIDNSTNLMSVSAEKEFSADTIIRVANLDTNTLYGELNIQYSDIANVQNITADKILNGNTIFGVVGSAIESNEEDISPIDPTTLVQVITPNTGYTGLNGVTINAVTSNISPNITANNIKYGVDILGIVGNVQNTSDNVLDMMLFRRYNSETFEVDNSQSYSYLQPNLSGDTPINYVWIINRLNNESVMYWTPGIDQLSLYANSQSGDVQISSASENFDGVITLLKSNNVNVVPNWTNIGSSAWVENLANYSYDTSLFNAPLNIILNGASLDNHDIELYTSWAITDIDDATTIYMPQESINGIGLLANYSVYDRNGIPVIGQITPKTGRYMVKNNTLTTNLGGSIDFKAPSGGYYTTNTGLYINNSALASVINLTPSVLKIGTSILGVDGNLAPDKPDQTKSVDPTTNQQIILPDTGYELTSVTVNAVTSNIDANIQANYILENITILNVTGTVNFTSFNDYNECMNIANDILGV